MRAASLERPTPVDSGPLVVGICADPRPGPGELLLRVGACAVCRTDLQLCEGDLEARQLPIVPGHQIVGTVEALGSAAAGWKVGDRAGIGWLAGACGRCERCSAANENLCEATQFTGWDRDGGYAELATVRADFALPLPEGFADVMAAPLLCGGIISYRALRLSGIAPGGRLGLYGFGASARLAIQVARHWGCEVFVATRSARDQERARRLGAVWAGGTTEKPPAPLDAAVTFAPVGEVVVAALEAVDRGGTVAINAIHLDRVPQFRYELLWWERSIRSVANFTRQDAREFLALAAEIPVETESDVYGLDDANRALADLAAGKVNGAAVLRIS